MGAADCVDRQPDACRQGRQAAEAAAMIEPFKYSDEQWDQIRTVMRDQFGLDADQIVRRFTSFSGTTTESVRNRIETALTLYLLQDVIDRQQPRRDELTALRKSAEDLRVSISRAVAAPVSTKGDPLIYPLPGTDADMLIATSVYFKKLLRNLDRQIKQAGSREDNARKPGRDRCWYELLSIWCELGGKASGLAAATFLMVASKPVMYSAVPDIASIMRWLRRQAGATR
jgi:hypothetical protein